MREPEPTTEEIEYARSLRVAPQSNRIEISVRSMAKHLAARRDATVEEFDTFVTKYAGPSGIAYVDLTRFRELVRRLRGEVP